MTYSAPTGFSSKVTTHTFQLHYKGMHYILDHVQKGVALDQLAEMGIDLPNKELKLYLAKIAFLN